MRCGLACLAVLVACSSEEAPPVAAPVVGDDAPDVGAAPDAVGGADVAVEDVAPAADVADVPEVGPTDAAETVDTVDTGPPPPPETVPAGACGLAVPVECGANVSGDTGGWSTGQEVDQTECSSFLYPGPEVVYVLAAPAGAKISATVGTDGQALDLHVLPSAGAGLGCDPGSCVAWTPDSVSFLVEDEQTVYLVVDGYLGDKGAYTLTVVCE